MTKYYLIAIFIQITFLFNANSQKKQKNITVKGIIFDTVSGHPIEYATILLQHPDSTFYYGAVTNKKGTFILDNIIEGNYFLQISFVGYITKRIDLILKNTHVFDIGKIMLQRGSINLEHIEVMGERDSYLSLVDKTVIVPDSFQLKSSATALDVMKKIPGVEVNIIENTISLIGSENVIVLINGIQQRGSINLKAIEPEQIDRIEIIQNPSVDYDSEYTGVINIILKKKQQQGFSLNTSPEYFTNNRFNESDINIEYGIGKLRLFGEYFLFIRTLPRSFSTNRKSESANISYEYFSNGKTTFAQNLGHIFQYGIDYMINDKNIINFTGDIEIYDDNRKYIYSIFNYGDNLLLNNYKTFNDYKHVVKLQNYSAYYKRTFNENGHELVCDINLYSMINNLNESFTDSIFQNNVSYENYRYQKLEQSKNSLNLKVDYNNSLSKKISFKTGYKFYMRDFANLFTTEGIEDNFLYTEIRNAAYGIFMYNSDKFGLQGGIRIENSEYKINNKEKSNLQFLPSFAILKKNDENNVIRLNYNRKLIRPLYYQLNPFIYHNDSLNYSQGNPYLYPAKINNINLNYTYNKKSFYFSSNLFAKKSNDIIDNIRSISDNNISYKKYENIAESTSYGCNISGSITIFKIWRLSPYAKISYDIFKNNDQESKGFSDYISLSSSILLPKNFSIDISISKFWKNINFQGYSKGKFNIGYIGIDKPFFENKIILSVAVIDPLDSSYDITYVINQQFYQESNYKINMRSFKIRCIINLDFGKIKQIKREYNMEKDTR